MLNYILNNSAFITNLRDRVTDAFKTWAVLHQRLASYYQQKSVVRSEVLRQSAALPNANLSVKLVGVDQSAAGSLLSLSVSPSVIQTVASPVRQKR